MTTGCTLQTHRAYTPFPRHLHSHYLHNLHDRGGTPGFECPGGVCRSVHQNPGKVVIVIFSIFLSSFEIIECPCTDILLILILQLCRFFLELFVGDVIPGLDFEVLLEHFLHPLLVRF